LQTRVQAFSTRFVVRAPSVSIADLRAAIRAEDPQLKIERIDTADALLDSTLSTDRLMAVLSWGFGVLAISLAAAGIYGLFSYEVTRRRGEIGIRMAVGAGRRDITRMIVRDAALLAAVGLLLGAGAVSALSRIATGLVFGISPGDPRITAVAAAMLVAVALVSAWFPARRATRVDPLAALRAD
jgi:ABC-type antimicrobial peptide transport system permease subunit